MYVAQSNDEAMLGFEYSFGAHLQAVLYGFGRYFAQNEQSHEDGNVIELGTSGVGLGVNYQF